MERTKDWLWRTIPSDSIVDQLLSSYDHIWTILKMCNLCVCARMLRTSDKRDVFVCVAMPNPKPNQASGYFAKAKNNFQFLANSKVPNVRYRFMSQSHVLNNRQIVKYGMIVGCVACLFASKWGFVAVPIRRMHSSIKWKCHGMLLNRIGMHFFTFSEC